MKKLVSSGTILTWSLKRTLCKILNCLSVSSVRLLITWLFSRTPLAKSSLLTLRTLILPTLRWSPIRSFCLHTIMLKLRSNTHQQTWMLLSQETLSLITQLSANGNSMLKAKALFLLLWSLNQSQLLLATTHHLCWASRILSKSQPLFSYIWKVKTKRSSHYSWRETSLTLVLLVFFRFLTHSLHRLWLRARQLSL